MKLYGIEIKNFFSTPRGVLIFDSKKMVFIPYPGMEINEIYGENECTYEKKIIVSGQFDKVKELQDTREYIVDVQFNSVIFRDSETREPVLIIDGLRY